MFYSYNCPEETYKIGHEELEGLAQRYAHHYNAGTQEKNMKHGNQVLLLIPTEANKLRMQWNAFFMVMEKRTVVDYFVGLGSSHKLLPINLLNKYVPQEDNRKSHEPLKSLWLSK